MIKICLDFYKNTAHDVLMACRIKHLTTLGINNYNHSSHADT